MDYTIVGTGPVSEDGMPTEPGFINGGMTQRGDLTSPVVVIDVESIDDSLKQIESLGGKTVAGKSAVAEMGFAAYFTDPEGNVIGLWENAPN